MLATRSLRLASIRCVHPSQCIWPSLSVRALPKLPPLATGWISRPLAANYCKDAKAPEPAINLSESPLTSNIPEICPESSDKPSSIEKTDKETKIKAEGSSTGAVADLGLKLPTKDQVEYFLFKSLVYVWDFAYYVFCLCSKLIETYVVKNPAVQSNWNQFLKRMEDARKDIKSK